METEGEACGERSKWAVKRQRNNGNTYNDMMCARAWA